MTDSEPFIFLLVDCFVNETTNVKTNETIQFTELLISFYLCISNASQVWFKSIITIIYYILQHIKDISL